LSGFNFQEIKGDKNHVNLLKKFNVEGKPIANLLEEWHEITKNYSNMNFYIETHKNSFFIGRK
jgi:hypothetical protein